MTIQRVVGTTEEMVDIFVQDATVSTGLGLPNLVISTFSSYYHRTDMTSTSSVTLVSTGTMGTWSSGQFLQVNSTFMRGWYQFCCPNGLFANGSSVALHMYGHPSMAPVVMRYDITRFNNQSTVVNVSRVGVSSFGLPVGVSSFGVAVGVSTIAVGVSTAWFSGAGIITTLAGRLSVDVSSIIGTKVVTTVQGYIATHMDLGLTLNSTSTVNWSSFTIGGGNVAPVGVSSISVAVSTGWFSGAGIVTTEAGRLSVDVSSIIGTKVVTTVPGYIATHMDLGLTRNSTSTVNWSSFTTGGGQTAPVGVSSISVAVSTGWFSGAGIVTTQAGRLSVDVSSIMNTKAVTTFPGYFATYFDLGLTNNSTSTVTFSGVTLSTYPTLDVSTIIAQMSTATILAVSSGTGVSSMGIGVGVTTFNSRVGVSSFGLPVGVSSMAIGVGVTTFNSRVGVSSFDLPVGVSSMAIGVGVTTFNSRVGVSSFDLPVGVSSMAIGVGVTTFNSRVGVSSFGLAVGVSSNPIGVNITSVTGITVVGTGVSSDPWGP